ncbi:tRNA guanosine(15) transglycosylase TgtA [Acidilobus sp.]|jgi:7-cyano-7-deazaguanine tRNA-ribosyltransferase|uniref:tRNA guanosine(15) transglycosylase TgtA n=1 Tax=Acidilobus sp. TaxID=1872109 RepID=UPI003CFE5EE2
MPNVFRIKDFELAGRIGVLETASGRVETPAFFPVVDPLRQEIDLQEIKEAGFNQVITNAYLLYRRFGDKAREMGVHRILGFDGVIMTDSGAYQMLEYGSIDVDQRTVVSFEKDIKSDIAVILDHPTGDVSRRLAEQSVINTLNNAREAISYLDLENSKTIWVLPIQGGKYLDLVAKSASESADLPYPMYGIGSPTVFMEKYNYKVVVDMIGTAKRFLRPERPAHLFGAGHPLMFPFAAALGIDTFDSASYMLYARDDRYITDYGTVKLQELEYFPCSCPVCRKYTPKDLLEMPPEQRRKLLAIHNLYAIKRSIERVKQSIREGRLWELLVEVSHYRPEMREALRAISKYYRYMESFTPTSKGGLRGARLFSIESTWNPRIIRLRTWVLLRYRPSFNLVRLAPLLSRSGMCQQSKADGLSLVYYIPYLGAVPEEICGAYPTAQFSYGEPVPDDVIRDLVNFLRALVIRLKREGHDIIVEATPKKRWSLEVGQEMQRMGLKVLWAGDLKGGPKAQHG